MARGVADGPDPFDFGQSPAAEPAGQEAARARPEPDPDERLIGERIRMRRKLAGLTQTKLADALGVTFQQVQKYESGANRVSAARLGEIARVLQTPRDFFYEGVGAGPGAGGGADGVTGFAERQAAFGGAEADVMARPETLALIGAYWRIPDAAQRRRVLELIKGMAG